MGFVNPFDGMICTVTFGRCLIIEYSLKYLFIFSFYKSLLFSEIYFQFLMFKGLFLKFYFVISCKYDLRESNIFKV